MVRYRGVGVHLLAPRGVLVPVIVIGDDDIALALALDRGLGLVKMMGSPIEVRHDRGTGCDLKGDCTPRGKEEADGATLQLVLTSKGIETSNGIHCTKPQNCDRKGATRRGVPPTRADRETPLSIIAVAISDKTFGQRMLGGTSCLDLPHAAAHLPPQWRTRTK